MNDHEHRPLSAYDHAPTIEPGDVDKCYECGRYAPHTFDHAPDCSRFEPIADDPVTVYTVNDEYTTFDAVEAESYSRRGAHVTASTSRTHTER